MIGWFIGIALYLGISLIFGCLLWLITTHRSIFQFIEGLAWPWLLFCLICNAIKRMVHSAFNTKH